MDLNHAASVAQRFRDGHVLRVLRMLLFRRVSMRTHDVRNIVGEPGIAGEGPSA
jgi:hypothetical protein